MKAEMRPGYRGEWAGDLYPLPFVVISPQHTVAPAGRAIASGGGLRRPCKTPADRAAKTRTFDHSGASITLDISFGISPTGHRRCTTWRGSDLGRPLHGRRVESAGAG